MARRESECPRVRVAALIVLDGRVVLVRHRSHDISYHLLPGGGVGYRETLAEALVREVAEETGLEVSVGRPIILNDTIDPSGPRHVVNVTFAADVMGGQLLERSNDPRVESIDLVEPSRIASLDLRPPFANELMDYIAGSNSTQAVYLGSLFRPDRDSHHVT